MFLSCMPHAAIRMRFTYGCSIRGNGPGLRQTTGPGCRDTAVRPQCRFFRPHTVRRIRTNKGLSHNKVRFHSLVRSFPIAGDVPGSSAMSGPGWSWHTVRPCRNVLVNNRFSYRLNLLVGKCFFSQSRKYRNEGTCIRQDIHSNTARHGGVCSSCHRRCISRLGMSAHKRLPVSCIQPSGFFGQIR